MSIYDSSAVLKTDHQSITGDLFRLGSGTLRPSLLKIFFVGLSRASLFKRRWLEHRVEIAIARPEPACKSCLRFGSNERRYHVPQDWGDAKENGITRFRVCEFTENLSARLFA